MQQRTSPREVKPAVSSSWPLVGLEAVRLVAFPFLKPREKPLVAASHTRTSSSPPPCHWPLEGAGPRGAGDLMEGGGGDLMEGGPGDLMECPPGDLMEGGPIG